MKCVNGVRGCAPLAAAGLLICAPALWGASIFGPSGVEASASIVDSYYGNVFGSCDTGLQALSAGCPLSATGTGQFAGLGGEIDPEAALQTGALSVIGKAFGANVPTWAPREAQPPFKTPCTLPAVMLTTEAWERSLRPPAARGEMPPSS